MMSGYFKTARKKKNINLQYPEYEFTWMDWMFKFTFLISYSHQELILMA